MTAVGQPRSASAAVRASRTGLRFGQSGTERSSMITGPLSTVYSTSGSRRPQTGVMRIGQVAAATGVTVEAVRFYERRGLLPAPARTGGGYRDYPDQVLAVVRFVKHAQQLGFTLDDIDGLL